MNIPDRLFYILLGNSNWQQAGFFWLVGATVLCIVAALVSALIQRRSADMAYRIWICAMAGVLLLPVFGSILPGWSVKFHGLRSTERDTPSTLTAALTAAPEDAQSGTEAAAFPHISAPTEMKVRDDSSDRGVPSSVNESMPQRNGPVSTPGWHPLGMVSWIDIACLVWSAVALVLLLRLVMAALKLARLVQRSSPAPAALQSEVMAVASSLGVRIRCRVCLLPAGSMPMVCWLGQPVMLLPEDIGCWPGELRRSAIAHELGHLMRRDAWSNLLGQVVWRFLWPHPVLWHARQVLPHLRERACDEWVLTRGLVSKHDYARHLLDVIGRCQPAKLLLAPQMARRPDLERRLRSVLAARTAGRNSSLARMLIAFSFFLLTAILAAGRPVVQETAEGSAQGLEETPSLQKNDGTGTERSIEPAAPDGPAITLAGVVVTPDAKPVKDASVVLRAKINGRWYPGRTGDPTGRSNRDVLARLKTDALGRFAFDKVAIPPRMEDVITTLLKDEGGADVLAWADGCGLTWAEVKSLQHNDPVQLTLSPQAKVRGVLHDHEGRGVPDARLAVWGITEATSDLDPFFRQPGDLNVVSSDVALEATTNKNGEFALEGLPLDFRVLILIAGPGVKRKVVLIDTGDHPGLTETNFDKTKTRSHDPVTVLHSPLAVTVDPQRFALVKIRDALGRAVGDGAVHMIIDDHGHNARRETAVFADGARIPIQSAGRFQVTYLADPLYPRPGKTMPITVGAGDDNPVFEIRLGEATWQAGRILDADTKKPVAGAYVAYASQGEPLATGTGETSWAVSGIDGQFTLPVAPGQGSLHFPWPVFGYFSPSAYQPPVKGTVPGAVAFDVPAHGKPQPVTLYLGRGLLIHGTVRNPDGTPAAGASVQAESKPPLRSLPSATMQATTNSKGQFEISGWSPQSGVTLYVSGAQGAAQIAVKPAPDFPLTQTRRVGMDVQLEPGVALSGRVLYKGSPRADVVIRVRRFRQTGPVIRQGIKVYESRRLSESETRTDSQGRYRLCGLQPGDGYYLETVDRDDLMDPDFGWQQHTVEEGRREIHVADMHLVKWDQTLRGQVTDSAGKPVTKIRVTAVLASDGSQVPRRIDYGTTPWTVTNAEGRFELRHLPDCRLEVRPDGGPQDVRIVLDPQAVRKNGKPGNGKPGQPE
jgi:beta-lactamase regulating signal transducer with metallopeptidase domain/protocatechuate 3,4-dioxygenase beta subunit